mgnify:CR=1 FL=1
MPAEVHEMLNIEFLLDICKAFSQVIFRKQLHVALLYASLLRFSKMLKLCFLLLVNILERICKMSALIKKLVSLDLYILPFDFEVWKVEMLLPITFIRNCIFAWICEANVMVFQPDVVAQLP